MARLLPDFPARFRQALKEAGYICHARQGDNWADFAHLIDANPNQISMWATGRKVPTASSLDKICAGTGKALSYFETQELAQPLLPTRRAPRKVEKAAPVKQPITSSRKTEPAPHRVLVVDRNTGQSVKAKVLSVDGGIMVVRLEAELAL